MTRLRREQCELNYEGFLETPRFRHMDTPGILCDLLLGALQAFGCTSADLSSQDDEPGERGVSCEIGRLDSSVTIRGDRIEILSTDYDLAMLDDVAIVMNNVWSSLVELTPGIACRTHSFSFQMDAEIAGISYRELLNPMARAPDSLPAGTETAVVYYLPAESEEGHGESSLVFNRSAVVERGLQIDATLVYEGRAVTASEALRAAQQRLDVLLRKLGLEWTED